MKENSFFGASDISEFIKNGLNISIFTFLGENIYTGLSGNCFIKSFGLFGAYHDTPLLNILQWFHDLVPLKNKKGGRHS